MIEIGPNLLMFLMALVTLVASMYGAYTIRANNRILKNGGPSDAANRAYKASDTTQVDSGRPGPG